MEDWIILKCDRDSLYIVGKKSHDHTFKAVAECFTFGIAEILVQALTMHGDRQEKLPPTRPPSYQDDITLLLGSER